MKEFDSLYYHLSLSIIIIEEISVEGIKTN